MHKRVTEATGKLRKGRGQTGRAERPGGAGQPGQNRGVSVRFFERQRPQLPEKR